MSDLKVEQELQAKLEVLVSDLYSDIFSSMPNLIKNFIRKSTISKKAAKYSKQIAEIFCWYVEEKLKQ